MFYRKRFLVGFAVSALAVLITIPAHAQAGLTIALTPGTDPNETPSPFSVRDSPMPQAVKFCSARTFVASIDAFMTATVAAV